VYRAGRFKQKGDVLGRDNYSYKKYQRELAKKKKQEDKKQRKLDKKNLQAAADLAQPAPEASPVE
jgi:hypothetical protein